MKTTSLFQLRSSGRESAPTFRGIRWSGLTPKAFGAATQCKVKHHLTLSFFVSLLLASSGLLSAAERVRVAPVDLAKSEAEGAALVAKMLAMKPSESITNSAVLRVRANKTNQFEMPVSIEVRVGETNWATTYRTLPGNSPGTFTLTFTCSATSPNLYELRHDKGDATETKRLSGAEAMIPFAGSDYWVADLGLEFLHWPVQRLVKKEICRGESCYRIESIAPPGQTNGYVRVVSWMDIDSFNAGFVGLVLAQTYDASGKMLKEFRPITFKKVKGEYQVEEMEMENFRTGSRTVLRFHLDAR